MTPPELLDTFGIVSKEYAIAMLGIGLAEYIYKVPPKRAYCDLGTALSIVDSVEREYRIKIPQAHIAQYISGEISLVGAQGFPSQKTVLNALQEQCETVLEIYKRMQTPPSYETEEQMSHDIHEFKRIREERYRRIGQIASNGEKVEHLLRAYSDFDTSTAERRIFQNILNSCEEILTSLRPKPYPGMHPDAPNARTVISAGDDLPILVDRFFRTRNI
ncbi:MAG: hypothetical protein LBU87_07255 [Lactobacillales bacterium]|jgi:hypothetical protein|nr:hypothetical protein [Lactobacillales bacterium]